MFLLLILFLIPLPMYAVAKDSSRLEMDEEERAVSKVVPEELKKDTVKEINKEKEMSKEPEKVKEIKEIKAKQLGESNEKDIKTKAVSVETSAIVNIRTAWYLKERRERIVIDLSTGKEPAVYKSRAGSTISINVETTMEKDKNSRLTKILQKTHYINSAQILSLEDEKEVLIQLLVKKGVREKVLTLANPARLVIDLSYKKE